MNDQKSCKTCYHSWETSNNLTRYCKVRISESDNSFKCTPYEIENGCERWEKADNFSNQSVQWFPLYGERTLDTKKGLNM